MAHEIFRTAALAALLSILACAPASIEPPSHESTHYQSAVRDHDVSASIERLFRSVMRLSTSAEYTTYFFADGAGVTEAQLLSSDTATRERALARAIEVYTDSETKGGTGVILARQDRRIALITNDHVTTFPAVRIEYFDDAARSRPPMARPVASISFRVTQSGLLSEHPDLGPYEVLARDSVNDLAVIEVAATSRRDIHAFPPIPAAIGDPAQLRWGSLLYVLGYPLGYRMATSATVSDPNRDGFGGFIADGTWNEGISGGPILAVRSRSGALEWVGLTRAGAGEYETRLLPHPERYREEPGSPRLYEGPVFAQSALRLRYGITLPVPMSTVRAFISTHRRALERSGYDLDRF